MVLPFTTLRSTRAPAFLPYAASSAHYDLELTPCDNVANAGSWVMGHGSWVIEA
jgi:hypothetical protein